MTDTAAWEQQIQRILADVRRNGTRLTRALEKVRGRAETRGVTVEVDAHGDITTLQIARGAMRWNNTQLESTLLDCYRRARADVKAEVQEIARKADPRLRQPIHELLADTPSVSDTRRPRTEEEIQAADDAYFERMNRRGWRR